MSAAHWLHYSAQNSSGSRDAAAILDCVSRPPISFISGSLHFSFGLTAASRGDHSYFPALARSSYIYLPCCHSVVFRQFWVNELRESCAQWESNTSHSCF